MTIRFAFAVALVFSSQTVSAQTLNDFVPEAELSKQLLKECKKGIEKLASNFSVESVDVKRYEKAKLRFETIRFTGDAGGCDRDREIVRVIKGEEKPVVLFDSGFYPPAYCDDPDRRTLNPTYYHLKSIASEKEVLRPLVAVEQVSTTIPCPDIEIKQARRVQFFDVNDKFKLVVDSDFTFIIPEAGIEPYRITLEGATTIRKAQGEIKKKSRQLNIEVDEKSGKILTRVY